METFLVYIQQPDDHVYIKALEIDWDDYEGGIEAGNTTELDVISERAWDLARPEENILAVVRVNDMNTAV